MGSEKSSKSYASKSDKSYSAKKSYKSKHEKHSYSAKSEGKGNGGYDSKSEKSAKGKGNGGYSSKSEKSTKARAIVANARSIPFTVKKMINSKREKAKVP